MSSAQSLEVLLRYFEVFLSVCKRAEKRCCRTQRRGSSGRIRERRGHKWRVVSLRVVVDGLKCGTEVGTIVVITNNLFVLKAEVMVRIRAIAVAMLMVVVGIDIIGGADSVRVIGITGWETDAAVMLSRTIGTLIKLRRRKRGGAHMRLRDLILGILLGRNRNVMLLRSIVIMRIRGIRRRGSKTEVDGAMNGITTSHVNLTVVGALIRGRMKSTLSGCMEIFLGHCARRRN